MTRVAIVADQIDTPTEIGHKRVDSVDLSAALSSSRRSKNVAFYFPGATTELHGKDCEVLRQDKVRFLPKSFDERREVR